MPDGLFKNLKPNFGRMISFGFTKNGNGYIYKTDIVGGQMCLTVAVTLDGKISTSVIDKDYGGEYVLHRVESAVGEFVGRVRAEQDALLCAVAENCFDVDVFKLGQTNEIIGYISEKYGDQPEFLWEKSPNNAIWRRKDNKKWYGALLTLKASKLGLESDLEVEIIDLRINPDCVEQTVDNKRFFLGYHMNKRHWITIILDGRVPTQEICKRIDESYILAKNKPKKQK